MSDWEFLGLCSSPHVEGERAYILTNRCEVLAADVNGMETGNDGEFQDEAKYFAGLNKAPLEVAKSDGDVIWRYDMREELEFSRITSPAARCLSSAIDFTRIPPTGRIGRILISPRLKRPRSSAWTKKLANTWPRRPAASARGFHGNWSSPAYGR